MELPPWWDDEPDDLARYLRATAERDAIDRAVTAMADARALAMAKMSQSGMTFAQIATETGLTVARVQQLVERGRRLIG